MHAKRLFDEDLEKGSEGVYIWPGLERKYPGAAKEWIWLFLLSALHALPAP